MELLTCGLATIVTITIAFHQLLALLIISYYCRLEIVVGFLVFEGILLVKAHSDIYYIEFCWCDEECSGQSEMIEVICNDRLGKKVRVKCNEDDTIGDLKKLIAAQIGTRPEKIRIQKWHTIYKDHITLEDYEIHDGMGLELYYN